MKTLNDLAYFKTRIPYGEFDPNIVGLSKALNDIPGLITVQSCGGHDAPLKPDQVKAGSWYVMFYPYLGEEGWTALTMVTFGVSAFRGRVSMRAEYDPTPRPDPRYLFFTLSGFDIDPDEVAEAIREAVWG